MRQPSPAHPEPVSTPRTNNKMPLVLWASFGFVLGFLPIIIFLLYISGTRNDRPVPLLAQLAAMASKIFPPTTTNTATAIRQPDQNHTAAFQPDATPAALPAQKIKPPPVAHAAISVTPLEQTTKASLTKDSVSDTNPISSPVPLANK